VKTSVALNAAAAGTTTRRSSTRNPAVARSSRSVSDSEATVNSAAAKVFAAACRIGRSFAEFLDDRRRRCQLDPRCAGSDQQMAVACIRGRRPEQSLEQCRRPLRLGGRNDDARNRAGAIRVVLPFRPPH